MRRSWALWIVAFVACGRSAPAPTPTQPIPAAAPAETPPTIDEVRALKTAGQLDRYEHALKALQLSSDPRVRGRAAALLALFYLDQNRRDAALPLLVKAAMDDPTIAPWMWLRIGDSVALSRVIVSDADATTKAIAQLRLAAIQPGVPTDSIAIDDTTEADFVALARATGDPAVRMRLLTEYARGRFTEENYAAVAKLAPSPLDALSADATLDLARKLGNAEHFDEALDLLRRLAQRAPTTAASEEYRDLRLRSMFASRHYTELLTSFDEQSVSDDPAMMLIRARAAWRDDKPQDFLAGLQTIERMYPQSPEAIEAKVLRAKYYTTDDRKLDLAIENLQQALAARAYGTDGENLWTLGWTYLLANRLDDALCTFEDYESRYPDGDYLSNSLFWSGKIYDRLGRTADRDVVFDRLESLYPYNYFSYRVRAIRHEPETAPSQVDNGNVFPNLENDLAALTPAQQPQLDRIAELSWLGLYRDALPTLKELAANARDNTAVTFMLADLYVQAGDPLRANGILQRRFRAFIRHGGSGVPLRLWEVLYPLPYWSAFQREGAKQNVDPYLLASIARQETIFEPSTVSNAGAVGVMQIMPAEAPRIAEAAGLQPPTREQLFDPEVNIAIGAAEYAQKRAGMNGNDTLTIAAYNAGPEAVGRWLAQTAIDDEDIFVESIPYNETRLYVKTVTRNRFEYRRIYENGSSSSPPPLRSARIRGDAAPPEPR